MDSKHQKYLDRQREKQIKILEKENERLKRKIEELEKDNKYLSSETFNCVRCLRDLPLRELAYSEYDSYMEELTICKDCYGIH